MWLCPTCKSINKDEYKKYIVCDRYPDQKEGATQYCPSCGTKYIVNYFDRFCMNYGQKIGK